MSRSIRLKNENTESSIFKIIIAVLFPEVCTFLYLKYSTSTGILNPKKTLYYISFRELFDIGISAVNAEFVIRFVELSAAFALPSGVFGCEALLYVYI